MGLNPALWGVIVYLISGITLLTIFDVITKRIRTKFTQASVETQYRLATSGTYVGSRLASVLFLGAMWLFWPMVFVGALTGNKKEEK